MKQHHHPTVVFFLIFHLSVFVTKTTFQYPHFQHRHLRTGTVRNRNGTADGLPKVLAV
jgi:hypothetical protein